MAGRCFGCGDEFGFFKREYDCGNCGRIFCSNCTSNSIVVPNKRKKAVKVCNDCFQKLTRKNKQPSQDFSKPTTNQSSQSYADTSSNMHVKNSDVHFDPDEDIQRRLEKLKESEKPSSESEIMTKFENLTGRTPVSAQTTDINTFGAKKTETEQMSDLIKQMQDECSLDDKSGYEGKSKITDEDIVKRLDKLKGREPQDNSGASNKGAGQTYEYDSDDEAEFRRKYIQQAIAESFLDDKVRQQGHGDLLDKADQKTSSKEYPTVADPDELPWCCICNEDATLRCHGCDDDLYCKRCFREGHRRDDYEDHTTSPYRPPRKPR